MTRTSHANVKRTGARSQDSCHHVYNWACKSGAQTSKSGLWSANGHVCFFLYVSAGSGCWRVEALPMPVPRAWGHSSPHKTNTWKWCPGSHFALCCCVSWTRSQLVSSMKWGRKVGAAWRKAESYLCAMCRFWTKPLRLGLRRWWEEWAWSPKT